MMAGTLESPLVSSNQTILVVGGGISGMTAALEVAECGQQVVLVEKSPSIGGRTTAFYRGFAESGSPACSLEIILRRIQASRNLQILTLSEVEQIEGEAGNYRVTIRTKPRYVNANCTACGDCARGLDAVFDNEHDYGLSKRKAVYLPHRMAFPMRYVIDPRVIGSDEADQAWQACRYAAIDLDAKEQVLVLEVGAVIQATGWRPWDAGKIQSYGYDRYQNVITSMEFERLADPSGPTAGKLLRPSDGRDVSSVAFVQCAGSRDHRHLRHCSRVCCMASLKQAQYVDEACPGADISVYYIDMVLAGNFDEFYRNLKAKENVRFVRSKVAAIGQDGDGNPLLQGVDTEGGHHYRNRHDLVVLATGMEASVPRQLLPPEVRFNVDGFIENDMAGGSGIVAAGCATDALDVGRCVESATAAALRAIQVVNRVAEAGEGHA